MSQQSIREITTQDLPKLAKLYVKVYKAVNVGEDWDETSAEEMLLWNYKRNPDLAFLAEENGEIVGAFFVAVKPWWDGNHLVDGEIFVSPEHQKKSIGTKLTEVVLQRAKEKYAVVGWDTYTFKKFHHPLAWYQSLGFTENEDWGMITGEVDVVLKKIGRRK